MNVRSPFAAGAVAGAALGLSALSAAAGGLQPQGSEFALTRNLPGDQIHPAVVLTEAGGFLAWQDAAIDGQGLGIAGLRLADGGSAAAGTPFRINVATAEDQENPALSALPGGGAFAVWQGGAQGFQRIFGRVLGARGELVTGEIAISAGDGEHHIDPVIVALSDGSVVVAWSAYRQEGSFGYDVFARRFDAGGQPLGAEFRLNATQGMNRRSPALAALPDGRFLAAWISERQVGVRDNIGDRGRALAGGGAPVFAVTVVARPFTAGGSPLAAEQAVSSADAVAANPVLAALPDGGVLAAWTRRSPVSSTDRYDVASRWLDGRGAPRGPERLVNAETYGDQYRPQLAVSVRGALAVWTSLGQDGSSEGVFGRWISEAGVPNGDDMPINSLTGGGQLFPAVAVGRDAGLLVTWSSNLPRTGFELFAQRLAPLLLKVRPVAGAGLNLQWPTVAGGVYQLEISQDGRTWSEVGGPRTAEGSDDTVDVPAAGRMVLYRVRRVR